MFRNYLAAALNNLSRNRLYAAISILGLAVGMAAAILTGLYIRDELSFDAFIPGRETIYASVTAVKFPGRGVDVVAWTPPQFAGWIKQDFPGVEATRLAPGGSASLRHGDVETLETIAWVDPNFFSVVRLPVLAGDPTATLARPDGVVLTRSMARKVFGRDAPIGETLDLGRTTPLRVGAVLRDLPPNTSVPNQIFVSALSQRSLLRRADDTPYPMGLIMLSGRTFVRSNTPAAAEAVNAAMPAFIDRHVKGRAWKNPALSVSIRLVSLSAFHFTALHSGGGASAVDTDQGNPTMLAVLSLIAALILLIAGINFVNLMTARAGRRMVEVGVRKVVGAQRRHLIVQFIGEAVVHALVALLLATVLVELALPGVRAALDRPLAFAYWRDPVLLLALLALAFGLGIAAGIYPALVQSRFRPSQVLKGGAQAAPGGIVAREALVVVQFAVLIALVFAALAISRQLHFAMNNALKIDKDALLMVDVTPPAQGGGPPVMQCEGPFTDAVRRISGVLQAACTSRSAMDNGRFLGSLQATPGSKVDIAYIDVGYGLFELYGLKPVAGRFFSRAYGGDAVPPDAFGPHPLASDVIVNEAAVKAMQMGPPSAVIGKVVRIGIPNQPFGPTPVTIVGVVPDFGLDLLHEPMDPRVYGIAADRLAMLNVKLDGRRIPETLKAVDQAWKAYGQPRAINRRFVDDYLQTVYLSVIRQGFLIDALCGVAVFIAALGLFGLAAFTAERRTKEIGVRKAMGASTGDILRLLVWQFTRPVVWANLIAWPVGWWTMTEWLHGFSARITLEPWLFLAASAAALAIAWGVVFAQAMKVAREKPVHALRYE